MENLDSLRQWITDEGVLLFDRQLPFSNPDAKAVTIRLTQSGATGIFLDSGRLKRPGEEASALLHECGHYATGTTHALCSPYDLVTKHEYKADKWAVRRALSAEELDTAVAAGYTELWELAEYFGVTEEFMRKAVCLYVYGSLDTELYF